MQVQIHYQGLTSSPWMEWFILERVEKLSRHLNRSASIQVELTFDNNRYSTSLFIHSLNHDYFFSNPGLNLYESFNTTIEKVNQALSENKRNTLRRINKRFFSIKEGIS